MVDRQEQRSTPDEPRRAASAPELGGLITGNLTSAQYRRLGEIAGSGDRMESLLDAVMAVAAGVELQGTLQRIVEAAVGLVDAQYGALVVLDVHGQGLSDFVYVGISAEQRLTMGDFPHGRGIIGLLISNPQTIRLNDLSEHPSSVGFPAGHPPMRSFLGTPVRVRDEIYGNIYLTEKLGGSEFTADDEVLLEALASAAGVAVENARLFEETSQRQRRLEAHAEITRTLLSDRSVPDALRLIAQRASEFSRSDRALVLLVDDVSGDLVVAADTSPPELGARRPGRPLDLELDGLLQAALTTSVPQLVPDIRTTGGPLASLLPTCGPVMVCSFSAADDSSGVLLAARAAGRHPFEPVMVPIMSGLAGQAAIAAEFGRGVTTQRTLDLLADRERIARDLHDQVIQRLFATGMSLQSTLKRVRDPATYKRIHTAVEQLDETIAEIRTSIFDLQTPADDEPGGLPRLILETAYESTEDSGLTPAISIAGSIDSRVPVELWDHVAAVVREAMSNAVRHAHASALSLSAVADDQLQITVTDDGRGIGLDAQLSGLNNLRQRAEEHSGSFSVSNRSGGGTELIWSVPLPD